MSHSDFRNKTRLKKKEIRELEQEFSVLAGQPVSLGGSVEKAIYKGNRFHRAALKEVLVYIVDKEIVAFHLEKDP